MNKSPHQTKIIVGMSGGVDSSVTALLLKQQGYDVHGVFMKNWDDDQDEHCPARQDYADAKAVATRLDIPLHSVNFAKEYWDKVFSHFLTEYQAGRTPNPDILCNTEIKFKAFLDYALEQGADFIATGHYAQIQHQNGCYQLLKGLDEGKDQSYFLHGLNQQQLAKSLFPVGNIQKSEVRDIAKEHNLLTHDKKDSTGICFIGERKFKAFLSEYLLAKPGNIETDQGDIIGKHDGLMFYTYGQRQGLKIGGMKDADQAPWYVVNKQMDRNVLIVAQGQDHPLLYSTALTCEQTYWISGASPDMPLSCYAKTRYRQQDQACELVKLSQARYHVRFCDKQRAITPGQSVVFYQQNQCLGGGVITAYES